MRSRAIISITAITFMVTACNTLQFTDGSNPQHTITTDSFLEKKVVSEKTKRIDSELVSKITPQSKKINEIYAPAPDKIKTNSQEQTEKPKISGDLSVEFNKVDIKQAIKIILGDLLKFNYVLHPNVQGQVTLKTVRPLTKKQMLGLLDMLLEAHGLSAIYGDGIVQIIPSPNKSKNNSLNLVDKNHLGFGVEAIPLENVSAGQMLKLLAPIIEKKAVINLPNTSSMLLLSGSIKQRHATKKAIKLLDVDAIAKQHVAIISLLHSEPETMISELKELLNSRDGGLIRFTPIKRLNALLIIAPNRKFIENARLWVKRLDRTRDANERRLFVYFVKHGEAANLTKTLKGAFADLGEKINSINVTDSNERSDVTRTTTHPNFNTDGPTNSILVWATGREYELISEVLTKLDIPPLQVLIEGTVLEVTLQDNLRYGLKYLIEAGKFQSLFTQSNTPIVSSTLPGFGAILGGPNNTKVVIDALSEITDVRVVSSPQLLVVDGGTASLHVGDQVPIVTRTSATTATDDNRITNEIEYRDTGVTLDITPKIKSSGVVTLNISQTVSDVVRTSSSDINSPTIQRRQVVSTASLQSGTTALLAGLIREVKTDIKSGLPILHKIPILGSLFGTTGETKQRTELIILITPKVMKNNTDAENITREILQQYKGLLNPTKNNNPQ